MPSTIEKLTRLKYLDLGGNRLYGDFPPLSLAKEDVTFCKLQSASQTGNCFTNGTCPSYCICDAMCLTRPMTTTTTATTSTTTAIATTARLPIATTTTIVEETLSTTKSNRTVCGTSLSGQKQYVDRCGVCNGNNFCLASSSNNGGNVVTVFVVVILKLIFI